MLYTETISVQKVQILIQNVGISKEQNKWYTNSGLA